MSSDSSGYPNGELLVETQWLAERLKRRDIRVVDMGTHEAYRRAHIPGAVHVGPGDRSHYLKDPQDPLHLMDPVSFAELMGRLGIGDRTLVIAYDAAGGQTAARLWWALDRYGHANCKLLNGGWSKWLLERRAASMEILEYPTVKFTPRLREGTLCTIDDLNGWLGDEDIAIIDVRSDEEWDGLVDRGNRRTGRVPGAIHFEWKEAVSGDDARTFLPAPELQRRLWKRGITPQKLAVTY